MRSRWIGLCVFCLASHPALNHGALCAIAQGPDSTPPIHLIPRTKEQREAELQAERRIALTVQVTDAAGKPVTGLRPDDFTLFDNQKPQKIAAFRELDGNTLAANAHVVVVLDGINHGGSAIKQVRKDLDKFLSQGNAPLPLPLSLAFVSSADITETQPTTDRAAVTSSLAQLARHPHDPDCIPQGHNRLSFAARFPVRW